MDRNHFFVHPGFRNYPAAAGSAAVAAADFFACLDSADSDSADYYSAAGFPGEVDSGSVEDLDSVSSADSAEDYQSAEADLGAADFVFDFAAAAALVFVRRAALVSLAD